MCVVLLNSFCVHVFFFQFQVLHSNVKQLNANIDYISSYRNSRALMSKAGYCLVNLQSALHFLSNIRAESLSGMESQAKLDELITATEKRLGIVPGPKPPDE